MSIIAGILYTDKRPASKVDLVPLTTALERYASGPAAYFTYGQGCMGVQTYASHARSAMDNTPLEDIAGNVVSFDGRLDNFREIAEELEQSSTLTPDSELVLAAFRRWGEGCFARLTGDWAIALWSLGTRKLYLARDHAGTRTLYYRQSGRRVAWATYLDPLVTSCGQEPDLSRVYAGRYLARLALREFTPYEGIWSVLPGHYVVFDEGNISVARHWSALVEGRSEYATDDAYDERFISLLRQAVERRTGAGAPILAELSGGMDSTSIVCMSDHSRRLNDPDAPILDTISYFDENETSLSEEQYFSITEQFRGKVGTHVRLSSRGRTFRAHDATLGRYFLPGADSSFFGTEQMLCDVVWERGYRSILSGIGGDEIFGGNPVGDPELADYFCSLRWSELAKQGLAWSLVDRTPLWITLARAVSFWATSRAGSKTLPRNETPWISEELFQASQHARAVGDCVLPEGRTLPSKWDNAVSWWAIMESLPHQFPRILQRIEYRYPLLDKDLVEFAFSVPRRQILKPGRRRFLMRRALRGIVPAEILERRQKAYQLHAPLTGLRNADATLRALLSKDSLLVRHGFIDFQQIHSYLDRLAGGDVDHWGALVRAVALELWLRSNCSGKKESNGEAASPLRRIDSTAA